MTPRAKLDDKPGSIDFCPRCGEGYDPGEDQVLECPECGTEGATRCCMTGGRGCLCNRCEETQT